MPTLATPATTPHLRVVRSPASNPSSADRWRAPEGATVIGALPESALPEGLLARYGAELGAAPERPLVGYLLLLQAEQSHQPTGPNPLPTTPPETVRPTPHGIRVDTDRRNAYVDGELLDLTYLEFELLAHLTGHPHRVHTREHLVSAVWGYGHVGDGRTVDVHVARLRRKLGSAYRNSIVTVRRVGYKYSPTI